MELLTGSFYSVNLKKYDGTTGAGLGDFCSGGPAIGGTGYFCPVFAPGGDLYVKLWGYGGPVDRYNGSTGAYIQRILNTSEGLNFEFNKVGELLAYDWPHNLNRYDSTSGALLGTLIPWNIFINYHAAPIIIRYKKQTDELFVLINDGSGGGVGILQFNASTGAYIADFVPQHNSYLINCFDFIFGADGNIYASRHDNYDVIKIDGNTGNFIDVFAMGNGLTKPHGIVFGPDGRLYVTSNAQGQESVYRFNGQTGQFIDIFAANANPFTSYLTFTPAPKQDKCHGLLVKVVLWILICAEIEIQHPPFRELRKIQTDKEWDYIAFHFWNQLSKEEQDSFTVFAIHRMSSLLNDDFQAKEIQISVAKLVGDKYELLHSLVKQKISKDK